MIVDCDRCEVRGSACGDCVIGVIMDVPEIDRPIPYLPVDPPGTVSVAGDDLPPEADPVRGSETGRQAGCGPAVAPAVGAGRRAATVGPADGPVEFAEAERRALQVLADQGLVPQLRLVEPAARPAGRADPPLLPVPEVPPGASRRRAAG